MAHSALFLDDAAPQRRSVLKAHQIPRVHPAKMSMPEIGSFHPPPAWLSDGLPGSFPDICPVTKRLFVMIARKDDAWVPLYGGEDGFCWTIPIKDNSGRWGWWQYDFVRRDWRFMPLREPHNYPGMERPYRN